MTTSPATSRSSRLPQGSIVALVTPMSADGKVDYATLEQLIEWHIKAGTDCIGVVGTTGESPTLDNDEHHEVIRQSVRLARGRVPIMAGAGANATFEAVSHQRFCAEVGADFSLQVVPYYNKPSQDGLVEHFKAVAAAANIPTVLYNVPGRTVADLGQEATVRLAEVPNIVGIKDATGNLDRGLRLVQAMRTVRPEFRILSGDDHTACALMLFGGHGSISVTANVVPDLCKRMCDAALAGDAAVATATHMRMLELNAALFVEANPIPVKWMLARMGKMPGGIRLPLTPLASAHQPAALRALQSLQLI